MSGQVKHGNDGDQHQHDGVGGEGLKYGLAPFGFIHIRVFKKPLADGERSSKSDDDAYAKQIDRLAQDFEDVIDLGMHGITYPSWSLFRFCVNQAGMLMFGFVAGLYVGIEFAKRVLTSSGAL